MAKQRLSNAFALMIWSIWVVKNHQLETIDVDRAICFQLHKTNDLIVQRCDKWLRLNQPRVCQLE